MNTPEIRDTESNANSTEQINEASMNETTDTECINTEAPSQDHNESEVSNNETSDPAATEAESPEETPTESEQPDEVVEQPIASKRQTTRIISGITSALLPIVACAFAVIAALNCEFNSKYVESPDAAILLAIGVVAIVIPFVVHFFIGHDRMPSETIGTKYFSLLPSIAALRLSFHTLTTDIGEWGDAVMYLSLLAMMFFIFKMLRNRTALKVIGAICVFLLSTAIIATLYLDFTVELNSPFKLAVQFGAVGLILGTIADARAALSRIGIGWFVFLKSAAASLGLICSGLVYTAFARGFAVLPELYLACATLYVYYAASAIAEIVSLSAATIKHKN